MMGKGSQRRKVDPLLSSNHSLNEMLIPKLFFGKDLLLLALTPLNVGCKMGKLIVFATQIKNLTSYKTAVEADSVFIET